MFFGLASDIMPELYVVRRRQKSGLSFARGTIRALASNISGVEPGDYGSNNEKDGHNVFEKNAIDDSSSKVWVPQFHLIDFIWYATDGHLDHHTMRWKVALGT